MPTFSPRVAGRRLLALAVVLGGLLPAAFAQTAPNVGIGTTAPTQTLDVNGSLRVRGLTGPGNRLPVVLPDGTLGVSDPVFSTAPGTGAPTGGAVGATGTSPTPTSVFLSGNRAYVTARANGSLGANVLQVFDVSNPASPSFVGSAATGAQPQQVVVSGTTAYVVNNLGNTLQTFDISGGGNPVLLGTVATATGPTDVAVLNGRAYVGCPNGNRFEVFDVSNPAAPTLLSSIRPSNQVLSVAVRGNRAYAGGFSDVMVYDISGTTPVQVGILSGGSNLRRLLVRGTVLYVASAGSNEVRVLDVSTDTPALLGTVGTGNSPYALALNATSLYTVNVGSNNLQTIDVTVPTNPTTLSAVGTDLLPYGVAVNSTVAVVVNQVTNGGSLQVFQLTSVGRTVTVNPDGSLGSVAAVGDNQQLSISGSTISLTNGGSVTVPSSADNLGNHTATQDLTLSDNRLLLRSLSDYYHGLRFSSAADGPQLYGGSGGELGYWDGTDALPVLRWNNAGQVGIGTTAPTATLHVGGAGSTVRLEGLSGTGGTRVLTTDDDGNLGAAAAASLGDNLGNHTATQALNLGANALVGTGADLPAGVQGVGVRADGGLNLGQNTGGNTIRLGYRAGRVSTGFGNLLVGYRAGDSTTTGGYNTFVGYQTGIGNKTGGNNVFVGERSGYRNTTGSYNLFVGSQAGGFNKTGSDNVFVGYRSGQFNTTGYDNLFIGNSSGYNNLDGHDNLFIGKGSGFSNTTAFGNLFIGNNAGIQTSTGNANVFVGGNSGQGNVGGNSLTAIGYNSGPPAGQTSLTNATAVGANVAVTQSNTVVLGNNANVGIGTNTPGAKLDVVGSANVSGNTTVGGSVGIGIAAPSTTLDVNGNARLRGLTTAGVVMTDANGNLTSSGTTGDNLGNHTATQNLNLQSNLLVGGTAAAPGTKGLYVNSAGFVGIGTTNPGHPLTIQSPSGNDGRLLGFSNGSGPGTDRFNLAFDANGLNLSESNVAASRLTVQNGTGNIGIGTNAAAAKLDVNGTFNVSGNATLGDNAAVTGTLQVLGTGSIRSVVGGSTDYLGVGSIGQSFTLTASSTISSVTLTSFYAFSTTIGFYAGTGNGGTAVSAPQAVTFPAFTPYTITLATPLTLAAGTYTFALANAGDKAFRRNTTDTYPGGRITSGSNVIGQNTDLVFALTYATADAVLDVTGNARVSALTGTGTRMVTAAPDGTLTSQSLPTDTDSQQLSISGSTISLTNGGSVTVPSSADNLGNHTATQAVQLNNNWLSNDGGAEGLRVDNAGKVGVGVAAPAQQLDVAGGILARGQEAISSQGAYLQWNRTGGAGETWLLNQQGGGGGGIRFGGATTANAATEWARFDGAGSFGIGVAPSQKLEVAGQIFSNTGGFRFPDNTVQTTAAVTATGANFIQNQTTQQAGSSFNVSGTGTIGGNATIDGNAYVNGALGVVLNGQDRPLITRGYDAFSSGSYNGAGRWGLFMESEALTFGVPAIANKRFQWATYNANSTVSTTLMTLLQNGNLGIGNATPSYKLDVNGTAFISSAYDLLLRDANHGLGWYGTGKAFGTATPDGPVLYGFSGGALGTKDGGSRAVLSWNKDNQVGIGTTTLVNGLSVSTAEKAGTPTVGGVFLSGGASGNANIEVRGGTTPYIDFAVNTSVDFTSRIIENGGLRFSVGASTTTAMIIQANTDRVGIGTTSPIAPLHVKGAAGTLTQGGGGYTFFNPGTGVGTAPLPANQSKAVTAYFEGGEVWVNGYVVAGALQTTSDRRIKHIVGLSDRAADLTLLNRLRITDYTYIDQINNTPGVVKKIIAQEVEEVLPTAVSRSTQALPNVYERATRVTFANGQLTVTTAKPHELPATGGRLRLYTSANVELNPDVTVVDAHTVRFASADAYADGLFVYGKWVDDFRSVDYDALTTLNVSATQELARKVAALEQQNAAQRATLDTQQAALQTLQEQMARLLGEAPPATQARK